MEVIHKLIAYTNFPYSDSLQDGWLGVRTQVGTRDFLFSTRAQTGLGPTQFPGSFRGLKRLGRGIDHAPPSCA
jgi:hypothetical protein